MGERLGETGENGQRTVGENDGKWLVLAISSCRRSGSKGECYQSQGAGRGSSGGFLSKFARETALFLSRRFCESKFSCAGLCSVPTLCSNFERRKRRKVRRKLISQRNFGQNGSVASRCSRSVPAD